MPRSKPPRKKTARSGPIRKKTVGLPPLPDRRAMEGLMAGIAAGLSDSGPTDDALAQAQDLMYDAWEAPTAKRRLALARKALKISPLCADAYVLLAEHAPPGSEECLELYRKGVEAGEAALGADAFEEDVGHFWGILETRPYMRARQGLADLLWERDRRDEAVGHYRDMLRLNPNDNQGIRYVLAGRYLTLRRDEELAALFRNYEDDGGTEWLYSRALVAFRQGGDDEEGRAMVGQALDGNPHVPSFLLGERRVPRTLPPYIVVGGKDEAASYMEHHGQAWIETPGAIDWLGREAASHGARDR